MRDALARHASLSEVRLLRTQPSPRAFGYRQVVKLVARRGREGLRLGVYRPGTHEVADIRHCASHHPAANDVLTPLASILERLRVPIYDERRGTGWLRYVVVRVGGERKVQLVLVVRDLQFSGERQLVRTLAGLRGVSGILLNVNESPGNALYGPRFLTSWGEPALSDGVGELDLRSSGGSFVQANPVAARRAYETVLRLADPQPGESALDLYCGVGAISLLLARAGASVQGFEESPHAVRDARANAKKNGLDVRFEEGDAAQLLARFASEGLRTDLITLNPPRRGAAPEVLEAISKLAPKRVVYMSCDPDTLARDLDDLAQRGFAPRSVEPFDFLPHTEHVEAVAVLERK